MHEENITAVKAYLDNPHSWEIVSYWVARLEICSGWASLDLAKFRKWADRDCPTALKNAASEFVGKMAEIIDIWELMPAYWRSDW